MKRILLLVTLLSCYHSLYAQWSVSDYEQKKLVTVDSVTYKIEAPFIGLVDWETHPDKETAFLMTSVSNKYNDVIGQYKDGSFVENPHEVQGIIIPQEYYKRPIYEAVRSAFSRERDLIPHVNWTIYVFVIVDSNGNIIETSTGFPSTKNHVIQPEQIATLESLIRKNLKFEVTERAKKYNFFEGQITICFQHYIEDMPEITLKEEEESFDDLPYVEGGNLTGPPRGSGGN